MTKNEALVKETLLHAAEIARAVTQADIDVVRAGVLAHGRSLTDAASITLGDVIYARLRVAAGAIK